MKNQNLSLFIIITIVVLSVSEAFTVQDVSAQNLPKSITLSPSNTPATDVIDETIPSIGDYVYGKGILIWHDEFEGNSLDLTKWNIELGTGSQYGLSGWGNSELQYYSANNITVNYGYLKIEAKDEVYGGRNFTSARITTGQIRNGTDNTTPWVQEKFSVKTGLVEARIRTSRGVGYWPAFWLLGSNSYNAIESRTPTIPRQGWPLCGEIDILEFNGGQEHQLVHAIHYGPNGGNHRYVSTLVNHPADGNYADNFHVYGVIWDETGIQFTLDGENTRYWQYSELPQRASGTPTWLENFYNEAGFAIIINLALGGNMGGGTPTVFDGVGNTILVDWVRVYKPTK